MKSARLTSIYALILLIIFGGIVLHAPLSVWLGTVAPQYDLVFKVWKEILMVLAMVTAAVLITRRGMWQELFKDTVLRLIAAFAAVHVLLIPVIYQGAAATMAGLAIDLRYFLYFGLVYVLLKLAPYYRFLMLQVGLAGAFLVVGFATLQFFLPPDILVYIGYGRDTILPYMTVDKNPDYIRVNSTMRGPNPLGAYAGMVLALLTAAVAQGRINWRAHPGVRLGAIVLGVCSFVALWISYSRSALVGGLAAVAIVLGVTVLRKVSKKVWIGTTVVIFAVAGALLAGGVGNTFISNVLLHENPGESNNINSNEAHVESLIDGTKRLMMQPLGGGVGSTGSASMYGADTNIIENQYLFVAHEAGWFGLALFIVIVGFVLVRLWQRRQDWLALGVFASGIGLSLIGILLPVWADDTVSIVWWGLAAIALATEVKDGKTTKQKTARTT